MVVIHSYLVAVALCVVTMICWGSWANTQKLASKSWPFQLFYWDYALGVLLLSLFLALTMGSYGNEGRSFMEDLAQGDRAALLSAFAGGIMFNLANILIVAAIDIAGMAVAFPVGIGLALVIGVVANYIGMPLGDPALLFVGVGGIVAAIVIDAYLYRQLPGQASRSTGKGLALSVVGGVLMGFFYRFVAASMFTDPSQPEIGKLSPYTAVFVFSLGLFLSNFIWNSLVMRWPFSGSKVFFRDYFTEGTPRLHMTGILGGIIWGVGMSFSIIASGSAGFAISYGLGQGATMVAAFWGIFVWKEFAGAPVTTRKWIAMMFLFYIAGLTLIILSRIV